MNFTTKIEGSWVRCDYKIGMQDVTFGDLTIKWHIEFEGREYGLRNISTHIDKIKGICYWLTKEKCEELKISEPEADLSNYEQANIEMQDGDETVSIKVGEAIYELVIDASSFAFHENGRLTIEEVEFNFQSLKVFIDSCL